MPNTASVFPEKTCALNGCDKPPAKGRAPNGPTKYCSREHMARAADRRRVRPASHKTYQAAWSLNKRLAAEHALPPHRCEYIDGCDQFTRIRRIRAHGASAERSRFCRKHGLLGSTSREERQAIAQRGASLGGQARKAQLERDPAAMAKLRAWIVTPPDFLAMHDRKKKHRVLSRAGSLGPNWNRKIAGRISEGLTGRTFTAAGRGGPGQPAHQPAPRERMLRMLPTPQQKTLSRLALLLVEDLADQADTKVWLRSRIEPSDKNKSAWSRGLKGFQISYSLDHARRAGYDAKAIANALQIAKSQAYEVLKQLHRADAARAGASDLIQRLSITGLNRT